MRSILLLGASMAAVAAFPVSAQTAAPASSTEAKPEADSADILIVGSRIRRDVYNSASPVQVITREESTLAGFVSTTEALQGTAVTGGTSQINNAFGGFVTDGGPGANTLSLRGLGATRSLLLLNGRRVAPAGTRGAVGSGDLNVLPNAIIDRIEILKDGASSIYGSDAVAGVVNIVTKKRVNGATVEGQFSPTHDGGGESFRLSFVLGLTGDRYSVSASFDYIQRNDLTLADRDWTQCNTDFRRTATNRMPGSGDFIDPLTGKPKCYPITGTGSNGVTINTIGTAARAGVGAAGSVGTVFNRWRPNSAITTGLVGYEGVGGGSNNLNVRDTFDPRTLNRSLISPVKSYNGFIQGSYDLQALGNAEFYWEVLGSKRESQQTGFRQLSLDYPVNSPLLPSTLQNIGTFLPAQPTSNGLPIGVRAFIGFGNDKSSQSVDFYKVSAGVRGDFPVSDWKYDLYASGSWSDASYTFQSFLTDRIAQSFRNCTGGTIDQGCVSAPALSSAVIGGTLPQAWRNFVFLPVTGNTKYDEKVLSFGLDGSLFALPYGNVQGAFGLEYRTASINDVPPIDSQRGNLFNLTSAAITQGSDSVWEAYGEVEVPILANMPFAEQLTVNGSARYTEYESYGGDWTYKVSGIYSPFKWLSFRGSYGTSYRAPALFEQFLGSTSGFLNQNNDPCNQYQADGSIRAANCASEGLAPGFQPTQSITVLTKGGADAGLSAETSTNLTLGAILQPDFGPKWGSLQLAVDYYEIEVSNGVSRAGATNILSLCYDDPDFRAGGSFCRLVSDREPGTNRLIVSDSYVNLATDKVRGIDYNLRYTRNLGPGELRLNALVTQYLEQASKLFADDPLDDVNGTIGAPEFTGTFDATYTYRKWQFRYGVEWIDGMDSTDYFGLDPATTPFDFKVGDYFTHNIAVRYRADKFEVTAGVRNLTDKEPPMISSGAYNRVGNAPLYSGYDYVGRRYFVNLSKSF
jgi:outer membrane receptor protein involved in Fe transport